MISREITFSETVAVIHGRKPKKFFWKKKEKIADVKIFSKKKREAKEKERKKY